MPEHLTAEHRPVALPLARLLLCLSCDHAYHVSARTCPSCGRADGWPLTKWLERTR